MGVSSFNHVKVSGVKTTIPPDYIDIDDELEFFDNNKRPLESIGITPDIEVGLDTIAFKRDFTDTQLNRALQYVRTGN